MSDLQLSFSNVYKNVSEFLGLGLSPTGASLTKVKDLTYRGYRRFLLPKNVRNGRLHTWSFLKQEGVINAEANRWLYPLPLDFQWFWYPLQYDAGTNFPSPHPVTMKKIMEMRGGITSSSYPMFWSLTTEKYSVSSGTQYTVALYPNSNSDWVLHYGYVIEPDKPIADADYFIGGALCSEAILECALAEAEAQEDDMKTTHHDTRAKELLHSCIEMDLKRVPEQSSMVVAHKVFGNNPELARDLRWYGAATSAYGIT